MAKRTETKESFEFDFFFGAVKFTRSTSSTSCEEMPLTSEKDNTLQYSGNLIDDKEIELARIVENLLEKKVLTSQDRDTLSRSISPNSKEAILHYILVTYSSEGEELNTILGDIIDTTPGNI